MSSGTTHLDELTRADQLAADVRAGLTATPKTLPPKYFYDAVGSQLFDDITRLDEYYPTRTERAILTARADEIAAITKAQTLNEIGSGTSDKTRLLLTALTRTATLRRFVPFDVDPAVLELASASIGREYPGIDIEPVVEDFERHLGALPRHPRRLVAFLGSTIGNLEPGARVAFYTAVRETLGPDDALLLGTDLVKQVPRLIAAYDDARQVTAAFNKNVLRVINRELDADFDLDRFAHRAVWDAKREWIEMRLQSTRAQVVQLRDLELEVSFHEGEQLRTEISAKFRRGGVEAELARGGLRMTHWWTDEANDFALSLSVASR